jgi:hypothetical protein
VNDEEQPISRRKRILQSIGALVVTALLLYLLLDIPVRLLLVALF